MRSKIPVTARGKRRLLDWALSSLLSDSRKVGFMSIFIGFED